MDKSVHWAYFIEFFTLPPIALLLAVIAFHGLSIGTSLSLIVAGCATWSLLEYWIHRIVLHHIPYFADQHDVHHQEPKSYIGVSTIGVAAAYAVVGGITAAIFGGFVASAYVAGIMLSYTIYINVHHQLHHGNRRDFSEPMTYLWNHHATHHRGGDYNFGVSTTLWDYVFGTKRS